MGAIRTLGRNSVYQSIRQFQLAISIVFAYHSYRADRYQLLHAAHKFTLKEYTMSTTARPEIKTMANLESAFAGESMAHIKYRYFAKLAREAGDEDTARAFEETADQEVMHAFGHLDLLYPKASMTPARALQIAIDGETYEYTEMYPGFRKTAELEGNAAAVAEMDEQIEESKVHAAQFRATLEKAQKRFAALAKVEERHANHYKAQLAKVLA
jgi:rubrerythrin